MLDDQQCDSTYVHNPITAQASVNCTLQAAQWEFADIVNNKAEDRRRSPGQIPSSNSHSKNHLRFMFAQSSRSHYMKKFKSPPEEEVQEATRRKSRRSHNLTS